MYEASIGMPSDALDPGTRGEEDVSEGESTAVCGGLQAWGESSAWSSADTWATFMMSVRVTHTCSGAESDEVSFCTCVKDTITKAISAEILHRLQALFWQECATSSRGMAGGDPQWIVYGSYSMCNRMGLQLELYWFITNIYIIYIPQGSKGHNN